eukprot:gene5924-biopygen17784
MQPSPEYAIATPFRVGACVAGLCCVEMTRVPVHSEGMARYALAGDRSAASSSRGSRGGAHATSASSRTSGRSDIRWAGRRRPPLRSPRSPRHAQRRGVGLVGVDPPGRTCSQGDRDPGALGPMLGPGVGVQGSRHWIQGSMAVAAKEASAPTTWPGWCPLHRNGPTRGQDTDGGVRGKGALPLQRTGKFPREAAPMFSHRSGRVIPPPTEAGW